MTIYLLGLYHCFQTKEYPGFMNYVRDFCMSHGINSIAEEMNYTALREAKRDKSNVKIVADELLVAHVYCDPDEKQRETLGILREDKLKWLKCYYEWTDEEFECHKALNNQRREAIWLELLQKIFVDPMLFVCGIDHLNSFGSLLEINGFSFQIAERIWTLDDCPQE